MSKHELPQSRVLSRAFQERGRSDVVKIDYFPLSGRSCLLLQFESCKSPWRQGVLLRGEGPLTVNGVSSSTVELFKDSAPPTVMIECDPARGGVHVYNIWARDNRIESQAWTSGMLIEELADGRRYRCNDIGFDTDFSKLVFRLERR